jgi:hypothetical protein
MQPNLPTYLLSCKRVHFFGDKHYKLYVTDYEMIISEVLSHYYSQRIFQKVVNTNCPCN